MMLVVGYTPRLRGDLSGLTGLLYEVYLYVCLILIIYVLSIYLSIIYLWTVAGVASANDAQ